MKTMRSFHRSRTTQLQHKLSNKARCSRKLDLGLCCAFLFPLLLVTVTSCGSSALHSEQGHDPSPSGFRIESAAFKEGAFIPSRFSCQGENISPALKWTDPPAGARSFALIVEDPDAPAGVWTHWVVFNLPAQARAMDENAPQQAELPNGGLQGLTSFGSVGYGGPCPPPGRAHRYFFRLYALDTVLSLQAGAAKQDVLAALKGHILGEAQLMGRFKR
jgi:Raf kinase inhibitor-like YbhB/YbcL family protein